MNNLRRRPIRGQLYRSAMWAGALILGACLPALMMATPVAAAETAAITPTKGILDVRFSGLRSDRGLLRACLTRDREKFLKCEDDPTAFKASVAAGPNAHIQFANVPPGDYALLVMHDENSNAKLDTMLGIPKEGIGFSRSPRLRFGPPSINAVLFAIPAGTTESNVKLQYFL